MLTLQQLDKLVELRDCQGIINDSEYSAEERATLRELAVQGLVSLCWVLTAKGQQRLSAEMKQGA